MGLLVWGFEASGLGFSLCLGGLGLGSNLLRFTLWPVPSDGVLNCSGSLCCRSPSWLQEPPDFSDARGEAGIRLPGRSKVATSRV